MSDKKCPSCGGTDFMPYLFADGVHGEYENFVDSFVCLKCGRVELYAKKNVLDQRLGQMKKQQEMADELAQIDAQIAAKQKELSELNAIINDENQTVKAVREAKEKIVEVKNQINRLQSRKSSVRSSHGFLF